MRMNLCVVVNNLLSVSSLIILGLSGVDFIRRKESKIAVTKYNSCIVELKFSSEISNEF